MKTSMQDLIEKLNEAQSYIISDSEYAKGYDGALSDCINVAESYLQKEKEINTEMLEMLERVDLLQSENYGDGMSTHIELSEIEKEIRLLIKKATL